MSVCNVRNDEDDGENNVDDEGGVCAKRPLSEVPTWHTIVKFG